MTTTPGDNVAPATVQKNSLLLKISTLILLTLTGILFYVPVTELAQLSMHRELYSHFLFIPMVSAYLLYRERIEIFANRDSFGVHGLIIFAIGAVLSFIARYYEAVLNRNDFLSLMTFSLVICVIGIFIFYFGYRTFRQALFPLLFLLFMVPIPSMILDKIVVSLQKGSAEAAYLLLKLTGVAVFREGTVFHMPGLTIEVAKQCSGIRSSLALVITTVLAGHIFLKTGWKKILLVIIALPVAIFKNGVRITTLSLLSIYIDKGFILNSNLHRKGGIVFFILALLVMTPILWVLVKSER